MSASAAPAPRVRGAAPPDPPLAFACAAFFTVVQFYTSLAALAPTPPVGYLLVGRGAAVLLVATLVASAAVCALRLSRGALPSVVVGGFGPWLAAVAVSSALGVAPLDGLQILGMMLLSTVFAAALVRFASPSLCRAVLAAYLGSGSLVCAAGLAMLAAKTPLPLYTINHARAAGFFVTANQFAAYLVLLLPIAAATALAARGRLRLLALASALLALPALLLTFSRAGWIGAAAAALLLAIVLGRRRLALALGLAVAALGVVVLRKPAALNHNPDEAFNRIAVWQGGLRAVELFPLTGAGPMAYWRVYPALRPPDGAAPGTFGALHPHNVVLSLAADLGLAGLAAAVYGWWRIGRAVSAAGAAAANGDPGRRVLAAGFAAALLASVVAGMFDTIGVVQMCFVWIPYAGLALAVAERGLEG